MTMAQWFIYGIFTVVGVVTIIGFIYVEVTWQRDNNPQKIKQRQEKEAQEHSSHDE